MGELLRVLEELVGMRNLFPYYFRELKSYQRINNLILPHLIQLLIVTPPVSSGISYRCTKPIYSSSDNSASALNFLFLPLFRAMTNDHQFVPQKS